jgi:hypothetical protein
MNERNTHKEQKRGNLYHLGNDGDKNIIIIIIIIIITATTKSSENAKYAHLQMIQQTS